MTAPPPATGWWILSVDGGARGNPGPAGAGAVLTDPAGRVRAELAIPLGRTTNNVAEYEGLLAGLAKAAEFKAQYVDVRSDSELLIRQMTGQYKVRADHLKLLHEKAALAAAGFSGVNFTHIPREQNAAADALANRAMDEARSGAAR